MNISISTIWLISTITGVSGFIIGFLIRYSYSVTTRVHKDVCEQRYIAQRDLAYRNEDVKRVSCERDAARGKLEEMMKNYLNIVTQYKHSLMARGATIEEAEVMIVAARKGIL